MSQRYIIYIIFRIQLQELEDWSIRYEKCLERCAFLEAGMCDGKTNLSPFHGISSTKERHSAAIVSSLFRKIEV